MTLAQEVPSWPSGLTDSTPLPYTYWRVMHATDGRRSFEQLSTLLGTPDPQLRQVQSEVRRWLERAAVREQPLSGATLAAVRQAVIGVMGPMGDLIVDDTLDELPDNAPLAALLSSLGSQLSEAHSQALGRLLRSKGIA